jgi:protein phosphatase
VIQLQAGAATEVGRVRSNNQDQLLVTPGLYAVADGMGGHAAGEVASLTAVESLRAHFQPGEGTQGLIAATRDANRSVWERAQSNADFRGMGTTLVAVAPVKEDSEDRLAIVNVGDSRLYLLRQGELEQLTTDHSLVQELVDDGQLSEAEATVHPQRHVLTRALGVDSEVNVDVLQLQPRKGDRLLLCSDGLPREVSDAQVASILRRFAKPKDAAQELVSAAMERGGNDNITVVVLDVVDDEGLAASASAALESDPGVHIPSPIPPDSGKNDDAGAADSRPGRFKRYRQGEVAAPKRRAFTIRVVGFLVLLLLLVGGAAFAVALYARGTYFVALDHGQLAIYKGRPGGLLWFRPTLADRTGVRASDVLPYRLADLGSGKEEPSLRQARAYVSSLQAEATTTTTAPVTTTVPPPATTVAKP